MGEWADDKAIDVLGLSEHHNSPDGYLSAPLSLAAMIAARTRRVTISVSALLVPLHEPLRLAPLCGGLPVAAGWQTLDLFATKVQPALG